MTRVANQGPVFLAFLQERGRERRGWADMTVKDMVAPTGIDTHDLTKMLRAWQKLGLVKFTAHRDGGMETLGSIRLTAKGMDYQFREDRMVTDTKPLTTTEVAINGGTERDGMAIGTTKRSPRPPVSDETKAAMQRARDARIPIRQIAKDFHVSQNSVIRYTSAPADETPPPRAIPGPATLLDGLAAISSLAGRQDRLLNAAAAIEGDAPDLAASILSRAQDGFTPLERDVLTLLERLGVTR